MPIADKIIPHYTYEDWLRWEGKWELIEGHPIAMSPTPIPKHQLVASEIRGELRDALRISKCKKCRVYDPLDYKISDDTILVPDILIICEEVKKKYLDFAPALVVEILSPSTALTDRNTKYQYYQQQGVKYYLIADAERKHIDVFLLQDGEYFLQQMNKAYSFTLANDCIITPDFNSIFE
jgi:Uma2 family endonuclease